MARKAPHRSFYNLWKEYFRDPSEWWDNRRSKAGSTYPDFKHKVTQESLWIDDCYNPTWVGEELRRRGFFEDNEKIIHDKELCHDEAAAFVSFLRDCAKKKDLYRGSKLHNDVLRRGLLEKCADALVTMYAKCGEVAKARELLDMHKSKDVFSWTDLIAGYVKKGQGQDALDCFKQMQQEGLSPDAVTFACILKACGSIGAADKGEQIHQDIARLGFLGNDIVLGNALVDMYAKCGALAKAQRVLEGLPVRDVVSWSALIAGFAQQGQGEQALNCFERMQGEGLSPNAVTFVCVLKACGSIGATHKGEQIHDEIARQGLLENNIVLGNVLVDMYAKCGAFVKAQQVLEELPLQDVVSWNTLITGYAQQDQPEQVLNCFEQMQHKGLSADAVTFLCILKACGCIGAAEKGEQIHDEIVEQGLLGKDIVLGTAVVDMYAKCGALAKAQAALEELPVRDVVSWSALISGYAQQGQGVQALSCFERMQGEGLSPNAVTFACILKACGSMGAADKGEQVDDEIARQGLLKYNIVLGSALVDMYAKCGELVKARQVLEELPVQNVVSWNALITGYGQHGQAEQVLNCFERMQQEGVSPNVLTFLRILKACGMLGAVDKGEQIHDEITRRGLLGNDVLSTAVVDMYAKCGALAKAQQVLEMLPMQSVISWNALIAGYAQQGQIEQALNCFEWMQHKGLSPDAVTFLCVLKACGSIGLVDDAQLHFLSMRAKYGIIPGLEHYKCMINVFGRAGHLGKAVEVIKKMPSVHYPNALWSALLGACGKWGDINVGRWAFEQAVQLYKGDAAPYVLMANIFADAGVQEDAENIETMRKENAAWRKPGLIWWTDMRKNLHSFLVGDKKRAQRKCIYAKLEDIGYKMSEEGYSSSLGQVSLKASSEAKESSLCGGCEKLALACTLMNTPNGETLYIVQNVRNCGDRLQ